MNKLIESESKQLRKDTLVKKPKQTKQKSPKRLQN